MENNTGRPDGLAGATQPGSTGGTTTAGMRESASRSAHNLIDKAEQQARSKLNAAQKDVGLTLSSVATTLLNSSSQLRDEQQGAAGEYIGKAAEQIDRLASYIQNADPAEVADNIQQFARRRPAVFIGAAFAIGVIGARFLKSSRRTAVGGDRLSSPGLTDREVPTLRSVEDGGTAANLTSAGMYGDGGFSASAGMPTSVPASGPHTGIAGNLGPSADAAADSPGTTGRGSSGELP